MRAAPEPLLSGSGFGRARCGRDGALGTQECIGREGRDESMERNRTRGLGPA